MKFGFFSVLDNPDLQIPYHQILNELSEQTRAVEQAGFDGIWLGEHHFGGEGFDCIPNPLMILSHLAAQTTTIRLGLAALIVPQWHPLRIAEDVAMLDQLSGGRVECGVGRGIFPRELTNLNIEADRRNEDKNWRVFLETVEIMKKAWTEDPFTWDGEFHKFPHPGVQDSHAWHPRDPRYRSESGEYIGMSIQPKPFQSPHPPLWNVVDKTPGFVVAAEHGLKPMTWLRARNGLREAFSTYQDAATRVNGRPMALGEDCALLRTTFVAETMEEARRIAEEPLNHLCKYVGGVRARSIYLDPGEELTEEDNAKSWFDFLMEKDHIFIGDPEFVAEKIRGIRREYQLESLLTLMAMPGLEHRHVMRSIELFAEKVMPLVEERQPAIG